MYKIAFIVKKVLLNKFVAYTNVMVILHRKIAVNLQCKFRDLFYFQHIWYGRYRSRPEVEFRRVRELPKDCGQQVEILPCNRSTGLTAREVSWSNVERSSRNRYREWIFTVWNIRVQTSWKFFLCGWQQGCVKVTCPWLFHWPCDNVAVESCLFERSSQLEDVNVDRVRLDQSTCIWTWYFQNLIFNWRKIYTLFYFLFF